MSYIRTIIIIVGNFHDTIFSLFALIVNTIRRVLFLWLTSSTQSMYVA